MAAADPLSACETHLISGMTSYPDSPARARRGGKLLLAVTVAPNGKVTDAAVRSSSGSRALDDAAVNGALSKWQFTPSSCGEFVTTEIAVQFERRMFTTFSGAQTASYRQKLIAAAERGCEISKAPARKASITCIVGSPARVRLAKR